MKRVRLFKKHTALLFITLVVITVLTILYNFRNAEIPNPEYDYEDDEDLAGDPLDESYLYLLRLLNSTGKSWTTFISIQIALQELVQEKEYISKYLFDNLSKCHEQITSSAKNRSNRVNKVRKKQGTNITLATIACSDRLVEAMTMLKSAVMFSQDASLHLIVFSDPEAIIEIGKEIICLKWKMNDQGIDFTYELHLEEFPSENWKNISRPCASQWLFFSMLLPNTDALIYIDTDAIVVSNLTELWLEFSKHIKDKKMLAAAPNDEESTSGLCNTNREVASYGKRGLQAGILLMNLTQMREFGFEEKAIAAHTLWEAKILDPDQDILDIVFSAYPHRMHKLSCDFNFNNVYCGNQPRDFDEGESNKNWCFCNSTMTTGARIVHGKSRTFFSPRYPFLQDIFARFTKFDFLMDTPQTLITNLTKRFSTLKESCHPLTAQMLYGNAHKYLKNLYH